MRYVPPFLFFLPVLALCFSCKKDCEQKGGDLTADERSWFVHQEGAPLTFHLAGTDSVRTVQAGAVVLMMNRGTRSVEEHCEWEWQAGEQQVVPQGPIVKVEHYGIGVEDHLNSARVHTYHFSDHTPQDQVDVGGTLHNGVYVMEGDASQYFTRILYSKSEGLLGYDKPGERWERVP